VSSAVLGTMALTAAQNSVMYIGHAVNPIGWISHVAHGMVSRIQVPGVSKMFAQVHKFMHERLSSNTYGDSESPGQFDPSPTFPSKLVVTIGAMVGVAAYTYSYRDYHKPRKVRLNYESHPAHGHFILHGKERQERDPGRFYFDDETVAVSQTLTAKIHYKKTCLDSYRELEDYYVVKRLKPVEATNPLVDVDGSVMRAFRDMEEYIQYHPLQRVTRKGGRILVSDLTLDNLTVPYTGWEVVTGRNEHPIEWYHGSMENQHAALKRHFAPVGSP